MPESDENPELPPLAEMTDASLKKMVRDGRAFEIFKIIVGDRELREGAQVYAGLKGEEPIDRYVKAAYLAVDAFERGSQ